LGAFRKNQAEIIPFLGMRLRQFQVVKIFVFLKLPYIILTEENKEIAKLEL